MVMTTFNLIVFFNVKVSLFFDFFDPPVHFSWFVVINLFFVVFYFFYLYIFISLFFLLKWFGLYFWL